MLEKLRERKYDVILLDISLPGGSGLDFIAAVKKIQPTVAILILSIFSEKLYAINALKYGALGYLTKTSAPEIDLRSDCPENLIMDIWYNSLMEVFLYYVAC